ncbi:uncharacterized protein LOC135088221 [Ostrinia nubilalis]|uniref:uncharacterized protein LOC135088221 n=1 Tax=Ostrinia nubilalis TaxID=29057 RepID=UPI0030823C8A
MALQHTPPNKFSASDTNIPTSIDNEQCEEVDWISARRRKQPSNVNITHLEERFNDQLAIWDTKITECIGSAVSSALSTEMNKISSVLGELNNNMTKLNADNVNITKSINETNSRLADLEKSLSYSHERQDVFDGRLKSVEDKLSVSEHLETQMNALEQKLTAMEQNARQCNLEICNIPERRGENLISIAESLGGVIACPIRASDIVSIHRVPHADSKIKRPKNVIVKLTNRMLRDNVISACRSTKGLDSSKLSISGPPATIYVNEHLTINNKLLFRQCRENARKQAYKYVWVKHGTILVRKSDSSPVIAIRTLADISKIK